MIKIWYFRRMRWILGIDAYIDSNENNVALSSCSSAFSSVLGSCLPATGWADILCMVKYMSKHCQASHLPGLQSKRLLELPLEQSWGELGFLS